MKRLRWTLGIALALCASLTALWWEENWRGRKVWEETCAKLRAKGEPVELADIVPPPVPDEENVAAAPIFAEVFAADDVYKSRLARVPRYLEYIPPDGDEKVRPPEVRAVFKEDTSLIVEWQTFFSGYPAEESRKSAHANPADAVMLSLGIWGKEWNEVSAALQRPRCRWPLDYSSVKKLQKPHLTASAGVLHILRPRLVALAVKGDSEEYTTSLLTGFRLARTFHDPAVDMISHLLGISHESLILWDWQNTLSCVDLREIDLVALQKQAQQISLRDTYEALQCERVRTNHLLRKMTVEDTYELLNSLDGSFMGAGGSHEKLNKARAILIGCRPEGWRQADAALHQEFHAEHVMSCVSLQRGTITPSGVEALNREIENLRHHAGGLTLGSFLAEVYDFNDAILKQAARKQARANQALLWCAIERHRLKHGTLPGTLDELAPAFLDKLPCDPVNGEPMRYVRKGDRDYLLYSIGWNAKDDGGVERKKREEGDWVWASDPRLIVNVDVEREKAAEKAREERAARRKK